MSAKWLAASIGALLLIVSAILATVTGHTKKVISVSEGMAQMVVELELPKMQAKGAHVEHLQLKFHDTADILLEVRGSRFGQEYTMVVWALGQPDLGRSKKTGDGELFFRSDKVEIRDFQFGHGSKPGELIRRASERYLINHPGMQNLASDVAPHVEGWMKLAAEHAAVTVLNHVPVYRLKTDTSNCDSFHCYWKAFLNWFATASVSDAKIVGNNLEITYSVWAIAGALLLIIVTGVICILLALVMIAVGVA